VTLKAPLAESSAAGTAVERGVFLAASPNGVKMWAGWEDIIPAATPEAETLVVLYRLFFAPT
jgi:hypothetical protein